MYGFCDYDHGMQHTVNQQDTMRLRNFVEAVLEYTGSEQVDIISHSLGVTYSRRLIKGGFSTADPKPFYIGEPLTHRVNTYIGIAGRNWGISHCNLDLYKDFNICNPVNGGFPGTKDAQPFPEGISQIVIETNANPAREGDHTYAIYSLYDEPYTFSRLTSTFPTMDEAYVFTTPDIDHVGTRDNSTEIQYNLVTYHSFDAPKETEIAFLN